jgi:hypothetical protein
MPQDGTNARAGQFTLVAGGQIDLDGFRPGPARWPPSSAADTIPRGPGAGRATYFRVSAVQGAR